MKNSIFFEPMMATGDFILHIETDDITSLMDDNESEKNGSASSSKEKGK